MKRISRIALYLAIIGSFSVASSADLIIDRAGNEISATVVTLTDQIVTYSVDTADAAALPRTIAVADVFMIKYGSGAKKVFPTQAMGARPAPLATHPQCDVSVLVSGGVFGLFNVDNVFTKASYTMGFTPVFRYSLNQTFSLGAEVMVLWGKPETADDLRLLINPNLRAEAFFALLPNLFLSPVIAAGVTIWPAQSGTGYLDSTLHDSRVGWDARAALLLEYSICKSWSVVLEAGYSASSSQSREVWITHDMMLIGLGPKFTF